MEEARSKGCRWCGSAGDAAKKKRTGLVVMFIEAKFRRLRFKGYQDFSFGPVLQPAVIRFRVKRWTRRMDALVAPLRTIDAFRPHSAPLVLAVSQGRSLCADVTAA